MSGEALRLSDVQARAGEQRAATLGASTAASDADGDAACRVALAFAATEIEPHVAAWESLARDAAEPNPFYEPWWLLALHRTLRDNADVFFAFIYESAAPNARLIAVFPLERARGYKRLPLRYLRLWKPEYCFLCTPLVIRGCVAQAMSALAIAVRAAGFPRLLEMRFMAADGAVRAEVNDFLHAQQRPWLETDRFERALLTPAKDFDVYFQETFDRKRRKEYKRQANRLNELGSVAFDALSETDDPQPWLDEFLRLEAAGWKGAQGTALGASPRHRAFFLAASLEAHRRGKLDLLALRLNGRTIAMKYNLLSGDGGFAFKIAYDEEMAGYSPGLQLELENIRRLHAGRVQGSAADERCRSQWMDSCADADHFMANRIWSGRRPMASLMIPLSRAAAWSVRALRIVQKLSVSRGARPEPQRPLEGDPS